MKIALISLLITLSILTHAQEVSEEVKCNPPKIETLNKDAIPEVPGVTTPLINIETPVLERNPKASYCKRSTDLIDTLVFHHSESPPTETIQQINAFHLTRGTADDPWYMIAYHYAITAPYPGQKNPKAKVEKGRPDDLIGAHAGSDAYITPSAETKTLMEKNIPQCGKDGGVFKPFGSEAPFDPLFRTDGKTKANNTTIAVVVIGNYSPFSRTNPNGYPRGKIRYPTEDTLLMSAKLACQLQKQYPRMKTIKWHNFYKSTSCPGTVKQKIGRIVELAKGLGCEFTY